jgi:hypothetical protein
MMGAWGTESFANDDALDWLAELEQASTSEVLAQALAAAVDEPDYLEVDVASRAVAAAEVVAALTGRPACDLPANTTAWVASQTEANVEQLVALARHAIDRVQRDSELADLWAESDNTAWVNSLEDLRSRLLSKG